LFAIRLNAGKRSSSAASTSRVSSASTGRWSTGSSVDAPPPPGDDDDATLINPTAPPRTPESLDASKIRKTIFFC